MSILDNTSLKEYNTFGIDVSAQKFCIVKSKEDVQQLIQKHFDNTKSTVANFVLSDFENQLKNFVKVFPKDYKKVLETKKQKASVSK